MIYHIAPPDQNQDRPEPGVEHHESGQSPPFITRHTHTHTHTHRPRLPSLPSAQHSVTPLQHDIFAWQMQNRTWRVGEDGEEVRDHTLRSTATVTTGQAAPQLVTSRPGGNPPLLSFPVCTKQKWSSYTHSGKGARHRRGREGPCGGAKG